MKGKGMTIWGLVGIAWEMGYLIALPLVGFALLGQFADRAFHTSPLFFILGVFGAIILSTVLVVHKTTQVIHRAANEEGEEAHSSSRSGGAQEEPREPSEPDAPQ